MTSYIICFTKQVYHIMVKHILTIISRQHISRKHKGQPYNRRKNVNLKIKEEGIVKHVRACAPLKIYVRPPPRLRTTGLLQKNNCNINYLPFLLAGLQQKRSTENNSPAFT